MTGLAKQTIPIVFGQGVDTHIDPKQLPAGRLQRAQNVIFESVGAFSKRNGYDAIKLKTLAGDSITTAAHLSKFKSELTIFADNQLYSYSNSLERVTAKGYTYTARPTSTQILNNSYNHSRLDSIAVEGLNVFVYVNSSLNEARYSVQDSATGGLIVSDALIAVNATNVRVGTINNYVYVLYTVGTNMFYRNFNIFVPDELSSAVSVANNVNSSSPVFDVVQTSTKIVVAYNSSVGGGRLRIVSILSDGSVGTGFGVTSSPDIVVVDVSLDSAQRVIVCYASATDVQYLILNFQLTSTLVAPTVVETISGCKNLTAHETTSNNYLLYYEISAAATYNHYIKTNTLNTVGTVGTPAVFVRSLGLAAKTFEVDDNFYVPVAFESEFQNTYFVLDEQSVVLAKISPEVAGGLITSGALPRVSETSDTTRSFASFIKSKNVSDNGVFFSLNGVTNTVIDFEPSNPYMTSQLGENLILAGGSLQMYDGNSVVEQGFHMYPETVTVLDPPSSPGGLTSGGNYSYIALYRWTDNAGQEHRSVPSIAVDDTITGSYAPTGTWATTTPVTITTVTTGAARNGNTITLQVAPAASNPTNRVLLAVTGTAAAVVLTFTPNSGANNAGVPVNLTAAQLATFIQSGVGSVAGTYLSGSVNITTSGAGVGLLADIRASGGGAQNLVDGGEGDGVVATLAGGANFTANNVSVPTLRLTAKTNVAIELYRTEASGSVYYMVTSPTVPTFNDTSVDTVTITDTVSDASLISRQLLYTTGGVLENTAPPASNIVAVHTASDRIFLLDSNTVTYSKQRNVGMPVEFNDALSFPVDPVGGALSSGISMDEKFILFETDACFFISGTGPNNAGQQDTFTAPERISAEIGCVEAASVVLTTEGIMFKSRKGMYLLSRSLQLSYIGAEVQRYNNLTITSAKTIGELNQVRFTTSNGDCLVYNYYVKQWATFNNHSAKSAEVIGTDYYYVRTDGVLFKENPTSFSDNGSPIQMLIETGWLSLNALQGFQRVYGLEVLGQYLSPHKLRIRAAYDFNEAYVQEKVIDTADFTSDSAYGDDSPYGSGTPYGGDGNVYQARLAFKKQKCQSIKLLIEDQQLVAGAGLSLSAMTLQAGGKTGLFKVSRSRKFGTE